MLPALKTVSAGFSLGLPCSFSFIAVSKRCPTRPLSDPPAGEPLPLRDGGDSGGVQRQTVDRMKERERDSRQFVRRRLKSTRI